MRQGGKTAESQIQKGLGVLLDTDLLHLNGRKLREDFVQRQTCRFTASSVG